MAYNPNAFTLLVHSKPSAAKKEIKAALKANRTVDDAAAALGIERTTLYRAMKRLKLKSGKPAHRPAREA